MTLRAFLIRPETDADVDAVRALTAEAFRTAPHASGRESAIVDALRAAGALAQSLVAEEGGAVVGHAAFSAVTIDGADLGWMGLGPVSVRPDRQRRGIGGALVAEGLTRIAADGARGCVVLGAPDFYGRVGFTADSRLVLPGVPPAFFLSRAFAGDVPSGVVAYHPAFGGV